MISGRSAGVVTITITIQSCPCTGSSDCGGTGCDKPSSANTSPQLALRVASVGKSSNIARERPPRPSRRNQEFLEGLSLLRQRQDRRRFRRL